MKNFGLGAMIALCVAGLAGCTTTTTIKGECQVGGPCTIGGSIVIQHTSEKTGASMLDAIEGYGAAPDAASFAIGIDGSTVQFPLSGTMVMTLVESSSGRQVAARRFAWSRSGDRLVLADPDAVNAWALASGGDADALRYAVDPFDVAEGPGALQVFEVSALHDDVLLASSTTTWTNSTGGSCRTFGCELQ